MHRLLERKETNMEGWYIAKVRPQKEESLTSFLEQWGVEVFYPKIFRYGRNGAMKSLFPTYVFCRLDPESGVWPVARWAPGMAYFLSHDGKPSLVPEPIVQFLMRRVDDWNQQDPQRNLTEGDKVVVLSGPFSGLEGVFQRYVPSRERCQILLETVGTLGTLELPEWEIRQAQSEEAYRMEAV